MSSSGLESEREVQKFDQVATDYSQLHAANVAASGEGVEYFAHYKIERLRRLGFSREHKVLDYGCGIGNLTRLLAENYNHVCGFDPSTASIELARQKGGEALYDTSVEAIADDSFDLAVLSGVLHHIPVADRVRTLRIVRQKLRPGGRVVIFEHNPLNPLTRRAVDTCPFDDDAILLPASEVRNRLAEAGFQTVRQQYIVFFPRAFSWFRPLEPALSFCPLGAQTLTFGTR